ncbi:MULTISPECIES: accessory Sec system glycosyltransferase GtfA [unclassified Staphylococcus]|uniref:accessory Sec system glycosyltransferase GtfA n=1 Tax=unclassified Staphylococcus TaxID=91994 RepID=UPI0021D086F2|nr:MULTISPECIES: accessory Sec system glycosyltransferase GtfA [unclassified Staphylococcus]UXR71769.1 accessory Sec system glycosyltransferase GtfA [Staphylococcus sp. IVB6240]UXR74074.1 accessory Sec system glycosyltransferase GtfA [Staphylococcus sp. IVB6238]UXR76464.1 accessory Sec system glycosyltransferase GtfA [Staphylococcus sp. IVB6233]UXR80591.1 accessory Sec system glycosyltransferase GtfA [Staphylococcus sp. IVB6218]
MTIYNINFGIGWASSGLEYAQSYRAKLLRGLNVSTKFVFLEFINNENIQTLTENIGFKDDEVIWLYQYFTDIPVAPTTYTVTDIVNDIHESVEHETHEGKIKRLYLPGEQNFITCYLKYEDQDIVDRAEFVINGMLVRKDFYSYVRTFSEYYAPSDKAAKVYMRQFYNENGTVAYTEYIDGKTNLYDFPDQKLYSREAFIAYFIQKLKLTSEDIVILDRASAVGQAILQNKGDAKVGVVVHAEHFSVNATDEDHVLWNNYYEYQFAQHDEIDFYITATDLQNQILTEQFNKYLNVKPRVVTIPVGSVHELKYPKTKRRPYSMISASRLASEKHIDWLVRAAIIAKKSVPELQFDIYGEGGQKEALRTIIQEHQAQDFIHLKGHVKLDDVYANYQLFVSGSTSEGFGLTLLEAVGSGLGMIGFDVNYGNPTFIRDQKNGYLIPIDVKEESSEDIVARYAEHIVRFFNDGPKQPHKTSYQLARPYLTPDVQQQWQDLISEVSHD